MGRGAHPAGVPYNKVMRQILPAAPHLPEARAARLFATAALAYLGLTLLTLTPLLPSFGSAIPGSAIAAVDGWQNVWHLWWAGRAALGGEDLFFTRLLYHPGGVPLHLQPINLSNGLLVLPVTVAWGPVAGYNTAVVLALTLSSLAGYALALRFTGHAGAAFVAGLIVGFSPFHLTRLWDGQLELLTLQWPAFYLLALLACVERPGWGRGLLAGMLLALTAYTSLYYTLYAAVLSALVLLLWLPYRQPWPAWARLAGALLVAAIAAIALLVPLLSGVVGAPVAYLSPDSGEAMLRSANLLDFLLPSYLHPLWGDAAWRTGSAWHPLTGDWNAAPGYSVLLLALLGVAGAWRAAWRWALLALACLALALGPQLQIGPWQTGIPGPYGLLGLLPGAALGRRPMLFAALLSLVLAVLAAFGLCWLLARCAPRWRPALLIAATLLIALEYAPPRWPLLPQPRHPAYEALAARAGAVLDIPPAAYKKVAPQQAQLLHGRPIVGGYLARMPLVPLVEEVPLFRALWYMEPGDLRLIGDEQEPLALLRAYGFGSVVVRWAELREDLRPAVAGLLATALPGLAPAYADAGLSVYHLPPASETRRSFALYGEGWYPEEADGDRRWRWMGREGELRLINAGMRPEAIELRLPLTSSGAGQTVTLLLDGRPTGRFTVAAQPAATSLVLRLLLPPGERRLTLRASNTVEETSPSSRALGLALEAPELHLLPAVDTLPEALWYQKNGA